MWYRWLKEAPEDVTLGKWYGVVADHNFEYVVNDEGLLAFADEYPLPDEQKSDPCIRATPRRQRIAGSHGWPVEGLINIGDHASAARYLLAEGYEDDADGVWEG